MLAFQPIVRVRTQNREGQAAVDEESCDTDTLEFRIDALNRHIACQESLDGSRDSWKPARGTQRLV
jgi:hypothetical protein